MDKTKQELASAERRNFLKLAGSGAFTPRWLRGQQARSGPPRPQRKPPKKSASAKRPQSTQ